MKISIITLLLISSNLSASTYLLSIDKKLKPYYKVITSKVWSSSTSTFTEWLNVNVPYDFGIYIPEITTQTETFNQTQLFKQDQQQFEQKREFEASLNIYQNIGDPIEHSQTINENKTREVEVVAEEWTLINGLVNCEDWSPFESSILFGEEFTQSRQCEQEKSRNIAYYIDSNLETTLPFTEISLVVEDQQAFGSNSTTGWLLADSSFSEWIDFEEGYDHLVWNPEISTQIVDFVQNRNYSQDQNQIEQPREQNSFTYEYRDSGESIELSQTITNNEERNITVELGSWINEGSYYDCLDFTPLTDTIEYGVEFTQNADCQQEQIATLTFKNLEDILGTNNVNQIITNNIEITETGTNFDNGWNVTTSTFTNWLNNSSGYNHTTWLPLVNLQLTNFTQSQDYSQDQNRLEQPREQNSFTSEIRNSGTTISREQTLIESQNRSVMVTQGNWSDSGDIYNCDTFTPSTSLTYVNDTVSQTQNCSQNQTQALTYKVASTTIDTKTNNQTVPKINTQIINGTKKHTYRVNADGYDVPKLGGQIYFDNYYTSASRSWAMMAINTTDYSLHSIGKYDIYGDASSAVTFNNDMNNIPNGYLVLITTWDEPCTNANLIYTNLENYFGASMRTRLDCNVAEEIRSAYYLVAYKNGAKLEENWEPRYGAGISTGLKELN